MRPAAFCALASVVSGPFGKAEVTEENMAILSCNGIGTPDIAVDDVLSMNISERIGEIPQLLPGCQYSASSAVLDAPA